MLLRPQIEDFKVVGEHLGKIIIGLALAMCLPLAVGACYREVNPLVDFVISILISFIVGIVLVTMCRTNREPRWMHGMAIASLAWIVAMLLGAIPLYLSRHWNSYLDACFEAMSGFATTGLTLAQDLDHLSYAHNFWRHLVMFIGGQGIIIVALAFLVRGSAGAFKIYVGEGREEKILPNVVSTARFIWIVSVTYLGLGTIALALVGRFEGMSWPGAFYHGACVFMTAFDTGGFTPQSQSILYYHSFPYEVATIVMMLLGAVNFKVHYCLWTGNRRELWRNIETVTLFICIVATFYITGLGLRITQTYPEVIPFFRKGFYHLISGQSGTGFMTIYAQQFINEWGALALIGITIAMAIGGSSCSTTGAIKAIRLGTLVKGLIEDVKRIISPEAAIVSAKFHHIKTVVLDDKHVRSAAIITIAYLVLYVAGALVGVYCGYPLLNSLFESTSAAANVGLSCGITQVSMPTILKVTYIFQMWIGRLEFISVFTLFGIVAALIKGK
ncbi:MAG: TrkH family potassium uptake protein [Candidatus Omnitrophota bacterium]